MKTINIIALAVVVLGAFVAVSAQDRATVKAYESWRAESAKQHGGSMPAHYALAAVTQRNSVAKATIKFLAVGKMPALRLSICPLTLTRGADGKVTNTVRGEQVNAMQDLDPSSKVAQADLTTAIPVDASNNAIEVIWTLSVAGKDVESSMILPLENSPSSNVMGITGPAGDMASR